MDFEKEKIRKTELKGCVLSLRNWMADSQSMRNCWPIWKKSF